MICTLMAFRFFEAPKEAFVFRHKKTHRLRSKNTSTTKKYIKILFFICLFVRRFKTEGSLNLCVSSLSQKTQASFNPCFSFLS